MHRPHKKTRRWLLIVTVAVALTATYVLAGRGSGHIAAKTQSSVQPLDAPGVSKSDRAARVPARGNGLVDVAIALGLILVQEFHDGLPPEFVVRGIPKRIDNLRPGMTWEQTREILGLETSWLKGGTGARFYVGNGNGHMMTESYNVRPPRIVVHSARVDGRDPAPVEFLQSKAMIQVWFRTSPRSGLENWRLDKSTRLVRASFSSDFTKIAEMPGSR